MYRLYTGLNFLLAFWLRNRDSKLWFAVRINQLYIKIHLFKTGFASLNPAF